MNLDQLTHRLNTLEEDLNVVRIHRDRMSKEENPNQPVGCSIRGSHVGLHVSAVDMALKMTEQSLKNEQIRLTGIARKLNKILEEELSK